MKKEKRNTFPKYLRIHVYKIEEKSVLFSPLRKRFYFYFVLFAGYVFFAFSTVMLLYLQNL